MAPTWQCGVLLATLLSCWSHTSFAAQAQDAFELEEQQEIELPIESIQQFVKIYGLVKDNYVEEKSDDALFQQAISGLVSGLDRYSRYLSPEDYQSLVQYTEGDLASVDFDIVLNATTQVWEIQNLQSHSDSSKLGLKNGVSVFKIDDQELKKLNAEQVKDLLFGSIGSTLKVQQTENTAPLTLVRNKKVEADIEEVRLDNQVLVIKVKVFQQDTANEIKRLIDEYMLGSRLKVVLLDLRNNPGGLLSAAVESADLFLNQGTIVSTKSRSEGDQAFQALPSNEFSDLKVGILINKRSASAAEVFTAALKEHGRAWVVGEKSYGKGVVQKLFPLPTGAALQMTVSHYYTPKGTMIEGTGIQPNQQYALPLEMKEDVYLQQVAEMVLKH